MEPSATTGAAVARCRRAGVGHRMGGDARDMARDAVAEALAGRGDPRLVLLFAAAGLDPAAVAAGASEAAAGVPVIGCSSSGEIHPDGVDADGVVALALAGPGLSVSTCAVPDAAADLREAGATVAACLGDVAEHPHQLLLLLTDSALADQQELVRGAYSVAGAGVQIVGAVAAGVHEDDPTHQLHDGEAHRGAVVAAALGSDAPFGVGVQHGWEPLGEPLLVTKAAGPHVLELDGRPALEAYLDRLGLDAGVADDRERFRALAAQHPLGLARRTGERHLRVVGSCSPDVGSLFCRAGVPQGSLVWLMAGGPEHILAATDAACAQAVAALGGADPAALLLFDCRARLAVLGDEHLGREHAHAAVHAGGAPVAGLFTFGEFARTRGLAGFHNHTLVALAVA